MHNNKTFLAVIPARGGSKRLPRKNILPLAGKPLIAWTIDAGLNSSFIDEVVVTTDDEEIRGVAEQYGAHAPFLRPPAISGDTSSSFDAVKHVVDFFSSVGKTFDFIILLQPTSPLRTAKHIDEAICYLGEKRADAVVSVSEVEHSPLWSNTLPASGDMSTFVHEEIQHKRSQDLEQYYRLNGAIYIGNTEKVLAKEGFLLSENIFAYKMKKNVSIDVDDIFDFELCKFLLRP